MSGDPIIGAFISGALTVGYLIAGLFFLRFWSRTGDKLFLAFAAAFTLMAANQALPVLLGIDREDASWVYLLRLAAFCLIIAAVLGKNLGGKAR